MRELVQRQHQGLSSTWDRSLQCYGPMFTYWHGSNMNSTAQNSSGHSTCCYTGYISQLSYGSYLTNEEIQIHSYS